MKGNSSSSDRSVNNNINHRNIISSSSRGNNNNSNNKLIKNNHDPKRYFESVPRRLVHEREASARLAAACFVAADASKAKLAFKAPAAAAACTEGREGPRCARKASFGLGAGQPDCQTDEKFRRNGGQWDWIRFLYFNPILAFTFKWENFEHCFFKKIGLLFWIF